MSSSVPVIVLTRDSISGSWIKHSSNASLLLDSSSLLRIMIGSTLFLETRIDSALCVRQNGNTLYFATQNNTIFNIGVVFKTTFDISQVSERLQRFCRFKNLSKTNHQKRESRTNEQLPVSTINEHLIDSKTLDTVTTTVFPAKNIQKSEQDLETHITTILMDPSFPMFCVRVSKVFDSLQKT
ncbi:hypothetical protein RCL1_005917 [Eukaryota sp. TZLM3-RCL]